MKILFTSVCRPLGKKHGDSPSVGYELLHSQVTRAQGLFSPRALHLHFSLEYIAENLDAPAVTLQYPSREELIRELKKGYDYVGVSFLLAVFHKMKETVALIRKYSPNSKIVLGGYGTVLNDDTLKHYADYICREEGVEFFRKLLGEPPAPKPYKHPLIVSKLRLFSMPVSDTGMVFAGLGCANGCDFCCTSHFFKRRHIRLLPDGKDLYTVIERYLDLNPKMSFTILDEDFLLNKRRAMEFRELVLKGGKPISLFVFSSIRAISQYKIEEILEMGIDGFWIGYEGTRSGFAKQQGRPVDELFRELQEHGVTILASMIVGFDYQDQRVVAEELAGLLRLKPCLSQFLIYGPTPGTPFYERIMKQNLLQDAYAQDPEKYYRNCDGFATLIKHPRLSTSEIEDMQRWCFDQDFKKLGPSIYRVIERWLLGYLKLKNSPSPLLAAKALALASDVRKSYPIFLAGRLLGPTPQVRRWIGELESRAYNALGKPNPLERLLAAAAVGAALWTWFTLKFGLFQHPKLTRTVYRIPSEKWNHFHLWEDLPLKIAIPGLSLRVELQHARKLVWLRLEGKLGATTDADGLWMYVAGALSRCRNRLVLDIRGLRCPEKFSMGFSRRLSSHRRRIRLVLPQLSSAHPEVLILAKLFQLY